MENNNLKIENHPQNIIQLFLQLALAFFHFLVKKLLLLKINSQYEKIPFTKFSEQVQSIFYFNFPNPYKPTL